MERFEIIAYIKHLVAINRLATGRGFTFSTCSGVQALEGLLTDMRDAVLEEIAGELKRAFAD